MACFARLGQRGKALHQYEVCARVPERELQLAPEPETLALAERIRRNEPLGPDPTP
jgi:DNA-binding SARP family transcriptional activator